MVFASNVLNIFPTALKSGLSSFLNADTLKNTASKPYIEADTQYVLTRLIIKCSLALEILQIDLTFICDIGDIVFSTITNSF